MATDEAASARALRQAGLGEGRATRRTVRALAQVLDLPLVPPVPDAHSPDAPPGGWAGVLPSLRSRGTLTVPHEPTRATAHWLATRAVAYAPAAAGAHLAQVDDRRSRLVTPVRRQLSVVGPMSVGELAMGVRRAAARGDHNDVECWVPAVVALGLWAASQPNLQVREDVVALREPAQSYRSVVDRLLAPEFDQPDVVLPRRRLVHLLVEAAGHSAGSAAVSVTLCPWLRPQPGRRGWYRAAPGALREPLGAAVTHGELQEADRH